jgi:hypothetical protein
MYTLLHNVQTGYGANTASYPMVAGEVPKGIKRPRHGADNSLQPRAADKNWTQTGKGAYIRTLCQKNKGPVKAEQGPIKMDSGSTHRSLTSKRTPF